MRRLLIGDAHQKPQDVLKVFDPGLLELIISGSLNYSSDSEGEASISGPPGRKDDLNISQTSNGQLYFKGYPECDFLRQVSLINYRVCLAH